MKGSNQGLLWHDVFSGALVKGTWIMIWLIWIQKAMLDDFCGTFNWMDNVSTVRYKIVEGYNWMDCCNKDLAISLLMLFACVVEFKIKGIWLYKFYIDAATSWHFY